MIVLFKVVLLIFMSTNTDLESSVTNYSKIDTNFTSFCYFMDKLISAVFTTLHMQGLPKDDVCYVRYINSQISPQEHLKRM